MNVVYCAAVPIDHPAPVRVEEELLTIIRCAESSHNQVTLNAVFPASLASLERDRRAVSSAEIIHLSFHGSNSALEMEDQRGHTVRLENTEIVTALQNKTPPLLILAGCSTEPLASAIHRAALHTCWIVSTRRDVLDQDVVNFCGDFYACLFADGDVRRSFDAATVRTDAWYLHPGESSLALEAGPARFDFSLQRVLDWASYVRELVPRPDELDSIRQFFVQNRVARWIAGPPRSGVTTLLHMAEKRFGGTFARSAYVDIRNVASFRELESQLEKATGAPTFPYSGSVPSPSALVCIDHVDLADPVVVRELLSGLSAGGPLWGTRFLLGSVLHGDLPSLSTEPLIVPELSTTATHGYLVRKLGSQKANELAGLVNEMPRLPGRLVDLVNDVRNGSGIEELRRRVVAGDARSGIGRQIEILQNFAPAGALMKVIHVLGSPLPRSVARDAFAAIYGGQASLDDFEEGVRHLRNAQLLRIESIQRINGGPLETQFICSADVTRILDERKHAISPGDVHTIADAALKIALARAEQEQLTPQYDAAWIVRLATSASVAGLHAGIHALGMKILGRTGSFRPALARDIEGLLVIMSKAARESGQPDDASHFDLLLGETLYAGGRLHEAEEAFRRGLSETTETERRVQFCRALGQISYRRGDYAGALQFYENALENAAGSTSDAVTTVKHHRGKVLFRLGLLEEALASHDEVAKLRNDAGTYHAYLQAQHERARVLQAMHHLGEAKKIYEYGIAAASHAGFAGLLAPAHYQLALVELEQDDVDAAIEHANKVTHHAERNADPLWQSLAHLLHAMIGYRQGNTATGARELAACSVIAREREYHQISHDVREWIMRELATLGRPVPVTELLQPSFPELSEAKIEKAVRYATQANRVTSLEVTFQSESATRQVRWNHSSGWDCSCDYRTVHSICSHIAALQLMYAAQPPVTFPTRDAAPLRKDER